ncbi:MAG: Octaprenyl diphosphate synthase [Candidatus Saccharicenans subterraneus]|uniref:Octaprenyl diphosphate synthase n=1 Tax=Candidatus Saccharicenans subterraneus TaxID=2508984 RepID=A0A3E2BQF0_9BACT|nr:MAG: Octaprenyl diphosphate synthase [Candidatus Saccharicenans subterraneum]
MNIDLESYLDRKRNRLEKALDYYLSGEDSPVFEAMRYAVLGGGKRFRPLLLLATGEHFGATEELLLPYACAVEFIHNYSLIHDDLPSMDDDDFRRGRPSCHKKFGEALALLAGDGLLTLAFEILATAPAPANDQGLKARVAAEMAMAAGPRGMIAGQWLDINFNPDNRDQAAYQEMASRKTAGLIRVSVVSGARLAGAPEVAIQGLEKFGIYLGLAFQLRDDFQDLGQDQATGKAIRPNLARILGRTASLELLETWLGKAQRALEDNGIDSDILTFFIKQLQPGRESST